MCVCVYNFSLLPKLNKSFFAHGTSDPKKIICNPLINMQIQYIYIYI